MKERPILFSGPMVRAILAGTKTQTRRVVKLTDAGRVKAPGSPRNWHIDDHNAVQASLFGQPGDRLWVRETWRIGAWDEHDGRFAIDYFDGPRTEWLSPDNYVDEGEQFNRLWRQSTDDAIKALGQRDRYTWEPGQSPCRWRPSIHMPRWASRITLEITGVRIERLQDISEADAIAEGARRFEDIPVRTPRAYGELCRWSMESPLDTDECLSTARMAFANLFCKVGGKGGRGGHDPRPWESNPWVWVVEFLRMT